MYAKRDWGYAKEFVEDVPNLDIIVSPVSGGGLLSGSLIYAKEINSKVINYFQNLKFISKVTPNSRFYIDIYVLT